jgi:predicted Zn-dependent peptidase
MESDSEAGISHLIEHMLFKGTNKRTAEGIAQAIEGRGGHLNAFTDREQTCYYARVLAEDLGNAVDVLGDMFVNSLFDTKELEKEKGVVIEEIAKYEDDPEEHIHDLHARCRWGTHPLGRPVIGTRNSVSSFTHDDIGKYMGRHYVAGQTFVAAAGYLDPETLVRDVEAALSPLEGTYNLPSDAPPASASGENTFKKDVEQVHFCIGGDSVSHYNDRKYAFSLMDLILGGSMSSRLFQEVREKRALVYNIGSYSALYREAGTFTIHGGTSLGKFDELRETVSRELSKMRGEPVSDDELARAKQMVAGSVVLGLEGMSARMHRIARNEMLYGRDVPIEETLAKYNAVTPKEIQELANEYLAEEQMTTTAIGPF